MKPIVALLAALPFAVASFAVHAAATPAAGPASRNFAATVPAAALTRVRINALVGDVHVRVGAANAVRVRLHAEPGNHAHFIFDWTYGRSASALPASLHLVSRRAGGVLLLCLASRHANGCRVNVNAPSAKTKNGGSSGGHTTVVSPFGNVVVNGNGSHTGWKANWTVTLPARLALKLDLAVGDGEIKGVGGGVNAQIGVGHLNAELPRGPVSANVGVGHIEAEVGSADYGPVNLTSGVGHVEFDVNGVRITSGFEHHVTASSQKLTGSGTTAYTLQSGVGHVTLKLGVKGLPSLPPSAVSTPQATSAPTPASRTKPSAPTSAPRTTSAPRAATTARL
ncbi:MAG: hypothetical protein ACRESR_00175 [Gammaproteobacteria bacterium]